MSSYCTPQGKRWLLSHHNNVGRAINTTTHTHKGGGVRVREDDDNLFTGFMAVSELTAADEVKIKTLKPQVCYCCSLSGRSQSTCVRVYTPLCMSSFGVFELHDSWYVSKLKSQFYFCIGSVTKSQKFWARSAPNDDWMSVKVTEGDHYTCMK